MLTNTETLSLTITVYTWFPEGKVVFVAPTKPLVAQQIEACHKTCGIPGSHAAELTGQNSRAVRARTVSIPNKIDQFRLSDVVNCTSGRRNVSFT